MAGAQPPTNPLVWVAAHARVGAPTVRRWAKRAYSIRRKKIAGRNAEKWIKFADALDGLLSASANSMDGKIGEIAWDTDHKKQLDALIVLRKRQERHAETLAASDIEIEEDQSVAHFSQEILDALTSEQLDALEAAQGRLAADSRLVESIIADAAALVEESED